jgi:cobalt-zinc-cadmium efflux system outer membrane protein
VRRLFSIALASALTVVGAAARADEPASTPGPVYVPRPEHDIATLAALVRRRAPALQQDLLAADLARADARQARLLGNPSLDATWGTIPVGETNPKGLSAPLANVPNYSVGLSYTFPIGKRGPRRERADALAEGAAESAEASVLAQALGLARVLGKMATARLRLDGLRRLVDSQRVALEIAKTRLAQGFGTPLDIDRLQIELERMSQQALSTEADERASLAACAAYVGMPCRGIQTAEDGRAILDAWVKRAATHAGARLEDRPDVRALDAFGRASSAEADLARAQAIPDPTVRLGYTRDTFTLAGNQENSLSVGVSVPVPIFDHGQAQVQAADARRARFEAQRAETIRTGQTKIAALRELLRSQEQRQESIERVLPRARAVVDDLERAANGHLLPYTDVIQARRTLDELLIEEVDSYGDAFQTSLDLLAETARGTNTNGR